MNYTPEQLNIFDFVKNGSGHGIIDAVAGAGKTTTIIESVAYVPEGTNMLFCAFNKSIATEIQARFHSKGFHNIQVRTMHALGYHILKANSTNGKSPKLVDNKYRELLKAEAMVAKLKPLYREIILINDLDPDNMDDRQNQYAVRSLTYRINQRILDINQKYRATLCRDDFEEFMAMVRHFGLFNSIESKKINFTQEVRQYFEAHRILLRDGNEWSRRSMMVDFTDMIYLPVEWKLGPVKKFDFVFIDECQDLSKAQLAIALKHSKKTARIMAVGDPRQSIYGFTGADIESFQRIKDMTKAKELPLTTCFRCPQEVIKIAKEIRDDIQGNKKYSGVVKHINIEGVMEMARANDLIISRFKAPLVVLVFEFINKEIKVKIHQDEARDFINELKSLFKLPERQKKYLDHPAGFEPLKNEVRSRWEFIIEKNAERIVDKTEREIHIKNEKLYLNERLDFLHKKSIKWAPQCACIEDILKRLMDYITSEENPIKLSSIHRAKGLEEDRIFIIDYDQLPHSRMEIKDWEMIQEINLKYVAVTRAKEELYLVKSEHVENKEDEGSLFDDLFYQF